MINVEQVQSDTGWRKGCVAVGDVVCKRRLEGEVDAAVISAELKPNTAKEKRQSRGWCAANSEALLW